MMAREKNPEITILKITILACDTQLGTLPCTRRQEYPC